MRLTALEPLGREVVTALQRAGIDPGDLIGSPEQPVLPLGDGGCVTWQLAASWGDADSDAMFDWRHYGPDGRMAREDWEQDETDLADALARISRTGHIALPAAP